MAAWVAKVPAEAMNDDRLTIADFRVLCCIALHDGKRGCFASHGTIAEETGLQRPTVTASVSKLGGLGFVTSTTNPQNASLRVLRVNYRRKACQQPLTGVAANLSAPEANLSALTGQPVSGESNHAIEDQKQFSDNRPEQTIKNRGEENRPSNIDVRKALEQTMVYQGGSLKRATRSGPDTSDPAVRKQMWESKCAAKLTETVDNADDIIDAYYRGEPWAITQFNAVSEQHGLKRSRQ